MKDEEKIAIIQRAKDLLCEHFEVGEILLQNHNPDVDETETWNEGWGNRLARDRHLYLMSQARIIKLVEQEDDEDDDDEDFSAP